MTGVGTSEYEPYPTEMANHFYSLLFCDIPHNLWAWEEGPAKPIFAPTFNEKAIRALADDKNGGSRIRALAYRLLRLEGCAVPERLVLGVVVETPWPRGLDALAAYTDGRVRYLHGSGKEVAVEHDVA